MLKVANVILWGTNVGSVSVREGDPIARFQYSDEILDLGIELSPIKMPLGRMVYSFPELPIKSFHGLPGLLSDSLPDKFGNKVIAAWMAAEGRRPEDFNAVDRLAYVGRRGMGALEYRPALLDRDDEIERVQVDDLAELADEVLRQREDARAKLTPGMNRYASILRVGSSAGGARAKALVAWNEKTGEVRSGQVVGLPPDFGYWLIKFDGLTGNGDRDGDDKWGYGRVEYAYYLMAKAAGISMAECRLWNRRHFMTRRFDRTVDGRKLHLQTLGALSHFDFNDPLSYSYEQSFGLVRKLVRDARASEELFRRTVFNVLAWNCDDHVKNISFLMDSNGAWTLSPAYDECYAYNPEGDWTSRHQMSVNGKRIGISDEDLLSSARVGGVRPVRARSIIDQVRTAVRDWAKFATEADVRDEFSEKIGRRLRLFLAWLAILAGVGQAVATTLAEAASVGGFGTAFTYDGAQFDERSWTREAEGRFVSPDGKLVFGAEVREWKEWPVSEIRPFLQAKARTGVIERFTPAVMTLPLRGETVRIRRVQGSETKANDDFRRRDVVLSADRPFFTMEETTGWPARRFLPYLSVDLDASNGCEIAVGWTGAWRADFKIENGTLKVSFPLPRCHFSMMAGERFELPRILVYTRRNESRRMADVRYHRFMIAEKSPKGRDGRPQGPALSWGLGGDERGDEAVLRQLAFLSRHPELPFDAFWIDAGWYGPPCDTRGENIDNGFWSRSVGDWRVNTAIHPDGNLRRISDACHAQGKKFLLWIEPERAMAGDMLKEHPEWFRRGDAGFPGVGWFQNVRLDEPAAWTAIVERVDRIITENGVDIYRQDFNMNVLEGLRRDEAPDRQGASEIRYVNGLWAFWDELRRRHPDLMFDNCASGGKRLDYEMNSRSASYWRDDALAGSAMPELSQAINLNATPFIPFSGGPMPTNLMDDDYAMLSALSPTVVVMSQGRNVDYEAMLPKIRMWSVLAQRLRVLYHGDFYQLTENFEEFPGRLTNAYQLHLSDEDRGVFAVFRQAYSMTDSLVPDLSGIDETANYELETYNGRKFNVSGRMLAHWPVRLPRPRTAEMIFYRRVAER